MKQSIDFNALGDKHKALESIQAGIRLVPNVPVIARLDGRSFHTYTKNAIKPFDSDLIEAMQYTTMQLVGEFQADLGYCQSDEITLVWKNLQMFELKVQKMCSTLSSHATGIFNREIFYSNFKCVPGLLANFDCRIWQVADLETAAENIMWRQWDAYKNSVSMAAHALFSNKELHGVNTRGKIDMMYNAGYKWGKLPSSFRRGSLYWKVQELKMLTDEELSRIPEQHRPTEPILRNVIKEHDVGRLTSIINKVGVLFNNEKPVYAEEVKDCNCGE